MVLFNKIAEVGHSQSVKRRIFIKRNISMLLMLLLCIGMFAGCDNRSDNNSSSGTNVSAPSDDIFSTENVKYIADDGSLVYRIIRSDSGENVDKASYLFKQMKTVLGVTVKNQSDAEEDNDSYEILIGDTNRAESASAKDYLTANVGGRKDDYIICTIGKKIVITGMTEEAIKAACEYFTANFVKPEGVVGGIKYTNVTQGSYTDSTVNGHTLGCFKIVKQKYNESYLTQYEVERAIDSILTYTGYALSIVEDDTDAKQCEIIVGDAARDGVEKIANKDEYKITVSGAKVYLNGGSPYATAMAVSEFSKMVCVGSVTDANSVSGNYSQAISGYDKSTYYTLKWNDDFDEASSSHATGIDMSKWSFGTDTSKGHNGRISVRSQNPSQLYVANGMLNFYASYDNSNYYGFKLITKENMTFRYGILEMSAILPHGDGFWISLWANSYDPASPAAFMTEVNVVEMFGNSASEASNLHGWLKGNQKEYYNYYWQPQGYSEHWSLDGDFSGDKKYYCDGSRFNDGLHTFTYIWDEDTCAFACDGNLYFSINLNEKEIWKETFTQSIYLILSEAVCFATGAGHSMDDEAPEWQTSNNFQIDYVHIYQLDDGKSELKLNP